jgi:ATP synthase protein I
MTNNAAAAMLRGALVPTLAVALVSVVVFGLVGGSEGLLGALIGAGLVLVFFGVGQLVLGRAMGRDPAIVLFVAMTLYTAKIILIGGTLLALDATGALDGVADDLALAVTTIVCALAWSVGQIVGATRARVPLYDLDQTGS